MTWATAAVVFACGCKKTSRLPLQYVDAEKVHDLKRVGGEYHCRACQITSASCACTIEERKHRS